MPVFPGGLTWAEVDPARHPFDPAGVAAAVPPAPPPAVLERGFGYRGLEAASRWRKEASAALVARYGDWASGWCWSVGEGDLDGGPVDVWCCAAHSITTPQGTAERVAAALVQWRAWLEGLAARFDRLLPLAGDQQTAWEIAVAQLVTLVVDSTRAESGWHGTCHAVLRWFLDAAGVPQERRSPLIDAAIGGRFRSWAEPSAVDIAEVAERLARGVTGAAVGPGAPGRPARRDDAYSLWRATRDAVDWAAAAGPVSGPVRAERDGVAQHLARHPDGVAALAALDLVRAAAAEGGPLTFARLGEWQRTVLGADDAPLRTGPAWAKAGRERYAWHPELPALIDAALADATDPAVPLPARAARVYLDIAFAHPFSDGNARSAALAMYFVLAREGVILDRADPILLTTRHAHDAPGAAGLAGLIAVLIDATRRHANRAPQAGLP